MDKSTFFSMVNNSMPQMHFSNIKDVGHIKCLEEMESNVLDRVGTLSNLN